MGAAAKHCLWLSPSEADDLIYSCQALIWKRQTESWTQCEFYVSKGKKKRARCGINKNMKLTYRQKHQ